MGEIPIVAAIIGTFTHNFLDTKKFKGLPSIPSYTFPNDKNVDSCGVLINKISIF